MDLNGELLAAAVGPAHSKAMCACAQASREPVLQGRRARELLRQSPGRGKCACAAAAAISIARCGVAGGCQALCTGCKRMAACMSTAWAGGAFAVPMRPARRFCTRPAPPRATQRVHRASGHDCSNHGRSPGLHDGPQQQHRLQERRGHQPGAACGGEEAPPLSHAHASRLRQPNAPQTRPPPPLSIPQPVSVQPRCAAAPLVVENAVRVRRRRRQQPGPAPAGVVVLLSAACCCRRAAARHTCQSTRSAVAVAEQQTALDLWPARTMHGTLAAAWRHCCATHGACAGAATARHSRASTD